ncbi:hypothetical protein CASFOL_022798 [Castilleja foliolosa]|uniref:Uncharacterized protein n=1 Tax=Castilleja foliolosa TaxID=1961234 RepID=A0ABD3CVD0_9LAMI
MASADNTVNNNNMEIQVYQHPQVGETAAAVNPTNAADSTPTNTADSSTTIFDNNNADSTVLVGNGCGPISELLKVKDLASYWTSRRTYQHNSVKGLEAKCSSIFRESCFGAYLKYPKDPGSKCGNAFDAFPTSDQGRCWGGRALVPCR